MKQIWKSAMTEEKFDALLENKEYEAAFDLVDKENFENSKNPQNRIMNWGRGRLWSDCSSVAFNFFSFKRMQADILIGKSYWRHSNQKTTKIGKTVCKPSKWLIEMAMEKSARKNSSEWWVSHLIEVTAPTDFFITRYFEPKFWLRF